MLGEELPQTPATASAMKLLCLALVSVAAEQAAPSLTSHESSAHLRQISRHSADMNEQVVSEHRQKLQMHHKEVMAKLGTRKAVSAVPNASEVFSTSMPGFFERSSVVQPVAARLSKGELERFLKKLSDACEGQFKQMLKGDGKVQELHRFGTKDHNTSKKSCAALDGALCATHARVQQRAQSDIEGRRLLSKSDVVGESCLPRSCIQEHDLHLVAAMMQQKAVESLGATIAGQQPAEVLLDVDCSKSGGSSYSSTSEWSMERAGPTRSSARGSVPVAAAMGLLAWMAWG